ncbi:MAG: DNA repair protein RecN [Bacteroidales bacterium]|nr:DNA repair protein RecN [Bacteroidales bacterium]
MLKSLYIDNYALIDNLRIEFNRGLSIITGETGAGKSILLGALSLILGRRADTSVLQNKEKKCIVEGVFQISDYKLHNFFQQNSIDYEDNTIIRREINANGKSRAFINDTPVTLETLGELTSKLVDIHSQHENLSLNNSIFQLSVIDNFGKHQQLLETYKTFYHKYIKLLQEYNEVIAGAEKNKSDLDYLVFQYDQLANAKLRENEQEQLETEQEQLTHALEIKSNLLEATNLLSDDEQGLISKLKALQNITSHFKKYLPEADNLYLRLESMFIESKDIYAEIEHLNNKIVDDPERLDFVNSRLDLIFTLQQKHHSGTVSGLINLQNDLKLKIDAIANIDFRIGALTNELNKAKEELEKKSELLSEARKQKFGAIQDNVTGILQMVGIPNASFIIHHQLLDDFTPNGKDFVQFLFSANKNMPPKDISKTASGGELSRFMLAIKSLLSGSSGLPTIIFDEIDTGVSGEIADKVGTIIKNMSAGMQVINITHLPQVAGKGDYHYMVYKLEDKEIVHTRIKLLTEGERHLEIAKMLSGKELTEAAMENAREMLKN